MSENTFAVYDIDNDGAEELIINYVTTYNAGMVKKIYDYDYVTAGVREEFSAYPTATIYDNGVIIAFASHNHGRAPMLENFWPYTLYKYNDVTDKYDEVAIVDAWDKGYKFSDYPNEADKDGDGIVYCVMTEGEWDYKNAMDKADYENWIASYIGGANEPELSYMEFSDACISIFSASDNDVYRNVVIDDDPNKTRDELALDIMEAYGTYIASLPSVSYGHFDELRVISIKSYDESDSDPESLIGVITDDRLKFDVEYAVLVSDTASFVLAGGWREGEGEYEGYYVNGLMVDAVRYNGRWYLVGMGNG